MEIRCLIWMDVKNRTTIKNHLVYKLIYKCVKHDLQINPNRFRFLFRLNTIFSPAGMYRADRVLKV
jgi:hypothetical protein